MGHVFLSPSADLKWTAHLTGTIKHSDRQMMDDFWTKFPAVNL